MGLSALNAAAYQVIDVSLKTDIFLGKSYGTTVDWMDSTSDETALWEKMMNSPNTWIEDTLPLRMLMVAKLTK